MATRNTGNGCSGDYAAFFTPVHKRASSTALPLALVLTVLSAAGCSFARQSVAALKSTGDFVPSARDTRVLSEPGAERYAEKVATFLPASIEQVETKQYDRFVEPGGIMGRLLDGERVVCNLQNDAGLRRYQTAIWNRNTEAVHLLPGTGSGWTYEVSGVSPAEAQVISVSYGSRLALLHNGGTDRAGALFPEFQVACPRYSPDGTRYAFFGADPQFPLSREQVLVIQPLDGSPARHILLQNIPHRNDPPKGKTLAWSPSGSYLAGYVLHDLVPRLFLWDAGGKLLQTVDIPFAVASWWAPVWLPDESGVMSLSEGIGNGPPQSITVPVPAVGTARESTR